ncbi:hypothetical protein [Hymenobacter wooponensis]|uniref:Uncharacterized protein n=1 Tax=Hymenobacter wooponensis TaxID=1525360 RepID=A0A4Z0MUB4_9BACT|nr:hypothetical protein [Hymenobacter wooponensis]TGD82847.1 hypothetical protein EU557_03445 [Hymenobacter wooponensis]
MPSKTTPAQRVAELLRELSTRRRVYPHWIDKHRKDAKTGISPEDAAHRIAAIEELIEDMYTLYPSLRPVVQASLFEIPPVHKNPPRPERP